MPHLGHLRTHAPQQTTTLFDHIVRTCEQRRRHCETERFGCLEVDDQHVLGRRLHWQVGRLLAFEDAINITGRALVLVERIRSVGGETPSRGRFLTRPMRMPDGVFANEPNSSPSASV